MFNFGNFWVWIRQNFWVLIVYLVGCIWSSLVDCQLNTFCSIGGLQISHYSSWLCVMFLCYFASCLLPIDLMIYSHAWFHSSVLIFVVKGGVFFCFLLHKNKLYSLLTILVFMAIFCAFFVKGWWILALAVAFEFYNLLTILVLVVTICVLC